MAVFGALVLTLVAGLSAWAVVEDRTVGALEGILGVEISLGRIRPSLAGITLEDLHVTTAEGGFRLRAESLSGVVNPLNALMLGPSALDGLEGRKVSLFLDLTADDTQEMLRRLERQLKGTAVEGGEPAAGGPELEEAGPSLDLDDLALELRVDADSSLTLQGADADVMAAGRSAIRARSLVLETAAGSVNLTGVGLEADDAWRLIRSARAGREQLSQVEKAEVRLKASTEAGLPLSASLTLEEGSIFLQGVARRLPLAGIALPAGLGEIVAATPRAETDLRWRAHGPLAGPWKLEGRGSFRGFRAVSELLADQPFDLPAFALELTSELDRREEGPSLRIAGGRITTGGIEMLVEGAVLLAEEPRVELHARLPRAPCDRLLAAVPAPLLGSTADFLLDGSLATRIDFSYDPRRRRTVELSADFDERCDVIDTPAAASVERFRQPFLNPAPRADGDLSGSAPIDRLTGPGTGAWTPIEAISPYLVDAVLMHEDPVFFDHPGFAIWAIRDALAANLEAKRIVLGASTISMQLAKNLFLDRDKTIARKLQEVIFTWWLERELDKIEMLELYLNVIEFGPDVYGVRQASWHYFGCEPSRLGPARAIYLATILPDPKGYHRDFASGGPGESARREMFALLERMTVRGWLSAREAAFAREEVSRLSFVAPRRRLARAIEDQLVSRPPSAWLEDGDGTPWPAVAAHHRRSSRGARGDLFGSRRGRRFPP